MTERDQIPDDFLRALGMVTVNWSHLEGMMHMCLITLIGMKATDIRPHAVFAHMSFPQKLDILATVIPSGLIHVGAVARYREVAQPLLKDAAKKRNQIVHSKWGIRRGQVVRTNMSAKGELKLTHTPVTLGEIEEISALIARASEALFALVMHAKNRAVPQSGQ